MRTNDAEALQSAYDTYAREILDRTMVVPGKAVAETVELARESGSADQKKAGRDLRQQLRQQSGKKRLYERNLGQRELPAII